MASITRIVVHCAATANGRKLSSPSETAAQVIDRWHRDRGFRRSSPFVNVFNPNLRHIGYHYVIDVDGSVETGRSIGETGAHAKGYNTGSIGICLVGTDKFTRAQWSALAALHRELAKKYPNATTCGHRDLSPDLNGDGEITPNEFTKICPGFSVMAWLMNAYEPRPEWLCV